MPVRIWQLFRLLQVAWRNVSVFVGRIKLEKLTTSPQEPGALFTRLGGFIVFGMRTDMAFAINASTLGSPSQLPAILTNFNL